MRIILSVLLSVIAALGLYPTAATVTEIDRTADIVTVEDAAGQLWSFATADDWQIGDLAALLMWDSGTESIYDDVILSVRYAGK